MELGNFCFGHSRGEVPIERGIYEQLWEWFCNSIHVSDYGTYEFENTDLDHGGFENDVFEIVPYCWCCTDGGCKNCNRPNFLYKPDNFSISWYKYPFRDSYSSKEFDVNYLYKILCHCYESWADENYMKEDWDKCECGRRKEKNLYKCWVCAK